MYLLLQRNEGFLAICFNKAIWVLLWEMKKVYRGTIIVLFLFAVFAALCSHNQHKTKQYYSYKFWSKRITGSILQRS